ncbi:hypothetical protein ACA910_020566 [Epithemia clementina (nom. ined.)]
MVRKSKQASGNATLTHYELRHKLTADHGTLERRLAGHAQYQLGDCGLSLAPLTDASQILCSPSGYLYEDQAILEYLITQTQQRKEQIQKAQGASVNKSESTNGHDVDHQKRKAAFESSQQWMKKPKTLSSNPSSTTTTPSTTKRNTSRSNVVDPVAAQSELRRTSYWLAEAQPVLAEPPSTDVPTSTRPLSPHSQQPLRRKDLWPVQLEFDNHEINTERRMDDQDNNNNNKNNNYNNNNNNNRQAHTKKRVVCALTGKPIRTQAAIAYWTTSRPSAAIDQPGVVVLKDEAFEQLIVAPAASAEQNHNNNKNKNKKDDMDDDDDDDDDGKKTSKPKTTPTLYCPRTNLKIKQTRVLQRSGSSFATSGQATVVQKYRPTLT